MSAALIVAIGIIGLTTAFVLTEMVEGEWSHRRVSWIRHLMFGFSIAFIIVAFVHYWYYEW